MVTKAALIKVVLELFATSHGKGPVDGIRGIVKRIATQKVILRKVNISNAASFYNAISGESNAKPFLIEEMEIRNIIQVELFLQRQLYQGSLKPIICSTTTWGQQHTLLTSFTKLPVIACRLHTKFILL